MPAAIELLKYNPENVYLERTGLARDALAKLAPKLDAARAEVAADLEFWKSGAAPPPAKDPLDAGFTDLPERLLEEYRAQGDASEVGRILKTARRLADLSDRVVVLGIGGSYMGARAILESCCHPFYNDLGRGARAGWPKVYFDGYHVDNDARAGLFDVLGNGKPVSGLDERFSVVVVSKSGGTLETAVAFRQYVELLRKANPNGPPVGELVVPVTGVTGKLADLATALGCIERYPIPDGVGGRCSIFTAVGLLPAALMGLNIVKLLEGAAAMNAHFKSAAVGSNAVLDYVGVCHLMEEERGANIRLLSTWGAGLEAAGFWYDQLLSESLGKQEKGATPLTVVNTRDLHSRGQQHQEGRRDKIITNVYVKGCKRDRLTVGASEHDQDKLNGFASKTLPDVLHAAFNGTNQAYKEDSRPTVDLVLPNKDEASMGQFYQLLMLATAVEGRMIGINPYGQPGVEAYKRLMGVELKK